MRRILAADRSEENTLEHPPSQEVAELNAA